jgi:hypothetical protein
MVAEAAAQIHRTGLSLLLRSWMRANSDSPETQVIQLRQPCGRCWQTNSNPSALGQPHCPLFGTETAPLGESDGAVQ